MTIKDIAQLSGYGIGTVSRVINNHPDVSDKARKRIMEVIEETNFQPNSNAKHLKMRASSSIAIIIKGNQNILFNGILEQIQQLLGIGIGETTKDRNFTFEVVRCIGACGLAPAIQIDNDVYKQVKPEHLGQILEKYV